VLKSDGQSENGQTDSGDVTDPMPYRTALLKQS
jgi:hypothetical protein